MKCCNNTISSISVMRLLTKFSEEKIDKNKDKDFDLAHINYLLRSTMIYNSILFWTMTFEIQSPLIAAFLAYVDCFFGYSMVYTLDSIKKFYQVYHHTHILSKYNPGGGEPGSARFICRNFFVRDIFCFIGR